MVNEFKWNGSVVFAYELCGSSYRVLEVPERGERYCYLHGKPSPILMQKCLSKPTNSEDSRARKQSALASSCPFGLQELLQQASLRHPP